MAKTDTRLCAFCHLLEFSWRQINDRTRVPIAGRIGKLPYPEIDTNKTRNRIWGKYRLSVFFEEVVSMEEHAVDLARKLSQQLKKFLEACKEEGDVTIDDVLRRLDSLKKQT